MAKILIVDDDLYSFSLFRAICTTKGYEATVTQTLNEGLKEIADNSYDLVMLDVHLPDGNGLEALPRFRAAASSPVVIILTGLGDPNGAELAINSGAWDYLTKPVPLQQVSLALTRALEHRQMEQNQREPLLLKRDEFAGSSPKLLHCLEMVAHAAGSDMNALIHGETGTGKEVLASIIHKNSARAGKSFVVVDCSSLPASLVESALFGHVKGAFTGAVEAQTGLIQKADGGTLFLDEVGELPPSMQKNFLRVLQERTFRPVGSSHEVSSNFRLIVATNRNLDQMVEQGTFREELLFRLKTIQIDLPPLRERKEDFHNLIIHFMNSLNNRYGHGIKGMSPDLLEAVQTYTWPGNVRELKSAVEYAYLTAAGGPTLLANHLPPNIRIHLKKESLSEASANLDTHSICFTMPLSLEGLWDQIQKQYLLILALRSKGKIREAIQISQLSKSRLYALFKKYGIVFSDK